MSFSWLSLTGIRASHDYDYGWSAWMYNHIDRGRITEKGIRRIRCWIPIYPLNHKRV